MGSSDRLIPDIILKKDAKDFVVVELKKESLNSCDNFRHQLFSYLKQLKVSIGILITNKIELFIYDYLKEDDKQQSVEIEFANNNALGEQFVNLFEKQNLGMDNIKGFVNHNCKIKDDFNEISGITNENFVKDILLNYFTTNGYNENAIENYLSNIKIEIKPILNNDYSTPIQKNEFHQYHKPVMKNNYNLDKNEAIRICQKNNIQLSRRCITFANLNINGKYPANVRLDYLNYEWTILLNDGFHKKLHILKIPPNTFVQNDFYIRQDKNLIVLGIDKDFVDYHPQQKICNRLFQYKTNTIDY